MKYMKLRYTRFADKVEQYYLKVISFLDLEDTDSSRVFVGVVASVGLYYTCRIVERLLNLLGDAAETVIAIIQ